MDCEMEPENDHDRYAVAVRNKDEKIVGRVPVELSKILHKFLSQHGQIEAECIGRKKGQIGKSVTYENVIVKIDLPCFEWQNKGIFHWDEN